MPKRPEQRRGKETRLTRGPIYVETESGSDRFRLEKTPTKVFYPVRKVEGARKVMPKAKSESVRGGNGHGRRTKRVQGYVDTRRRKGGTVADRERKFFAARRQELEPVLSAQRAIARAAAHRLGVPIGIRSTANAEVKAGFAEEGRIKYPALKIILNPSKPSQETYLAVKKGKNVQFHKQ